MKNNYTKLGKVTEIIGYLITFSSMFLLLIAFFLSRRFFGITEIITLLVTAIIIYFIGKSIYSFNKRYKKYLNDEIDQIQYRKYWRKSLLTTLVIIATSLIVLSKNIKSDNGINQDKIEYSKKENNSSIAKYEQLRNSKLYRYSFNVVLYLPLILLIPQLYFLYKTSAKQLKNIDSEDTTQIVATIKNKLSIIENFNTKELIILSFVFGTIVALIMGYLFGETWHYNSRGIKLRRVSFFTSDKGLGYNEFHFNYILGIASLIIVTGISYLLLINRKNERKD